VECHGGERGATGLRRRRRYSVPGVPLLLRGRPAAGQAGLSHLDVLKAGISGEPATVSTVLLPTWPAATMPSAAKMYLPALGKVSRAGKAVALPAWRSTRGLASLQARVFGLWVLPTHPPAMYPKSSGWVCEKVSRSAPRDTICNKRSCDSMNALGAAAGPLKLTLRRLAAVPAVTAAGLTVSVLGTASMLPIAAAREQQQLMESRTASVRHAAIAGSPFRV
jgi:hypothetical protein